MKYLMKEISFNKGHDCNENLFKTREQLYISDYL